MSVALVNGYVLVPTRPNWRESVTWKRSWQTEIAGALQGQEDRRSLRRIPRVALTWLLTTLGAEETAILETRIQAALKSGLACTGYWGRACEIKTDVTSTSAELWPSSWPWAAGDYVLFIDPITGAFDAILVDGVTGNTLNLHTAVSRTYHACGLCWPIIFGKLAADPLAPMTSDKADVKLTLLNALPSPCTVPAAADWCGHCNPGLEPILLQPACTPLLPPTALTVGATACSDSPITVNTLTPTLSWTAPTGAAGYIVEIFTGSCGGTLVHTSPTQTDPNYTVPGGVLDLDVTYYWRVIPTPSTGYCEGEASPCCAITTACADLATPAGLAPCGTDGSPASISLTPTLSWGAVTGAASYVVEIFTLSCGGTLIHTSPTLTDPAYTVPEDVLSYCTKYWWRVTANPDTGHCAAVTSDCCVVEALLVSDNGCGDCAASTPTCTVSGVTPTDNGVGGNGVYAFTSFSPDAGEGTCAWNFQGPQSVTPYANWGLSLIGSGASYSVGIGDSHGAVDESVSSDIVCVCGQLKGTAHLSGGGTVTFS